MKKSFLFFLFIGCIQVKAQTGNLQRTDSAAKEYNSVIYLKGMYFLGSNSMTNGLLKNYIFNGFISDEMKNRVSNNLNDNNRLGAEYSIALGCRIHRDSFFGLRNIFYTIELKNVNHIDAGFSKDLFEVFFRGNKNYAGRTADFSDFNYNFLQYQEFKFGLLKDYRNDSSLTTVAAGISLVKGQHFQHIKADKATLYTDPNGEFINANFNMQLNESDSLKKDISAFNGFGLATDLSYTYLSDKKYFVNVSVQDFGFILWNDHSSEIKADSSYRFEGIVSNDLFNFQDSVRGKSTNLDSVYVQPFLNNHFYKSYTTILPATFALSIGKEIRTGIPGKVKVSANVNYRINANYMPLTWIELVHESLRRTIVKLDFAYGGYSNFFINLAFEKKYEKGWCIGVGITHINEMLNFMNGSGQGAFVSLSKGFGYVPATTK